MQKASLSHRAAIFLRIFTKKVPARQRGSSKIQQSAWGDESENDHGNSNDFWERVNYPGRVKRFSPKSGCFARGGKKFKRAFGLMKNRFGVQFKTETSDEVVSQVFPNESHP